MATNRKLEGFNRKRTLLYHLPAVGYAALIFALSSMTLDMEELQPVLTFDKLLHLASTTSSGTAQMGVHDIGPLLAASPSPLRSSSGAHWGLSDEIHRPSCRQGGQPVGSPVDAAGVGLAACTFRLSSSAGAVRALEDRIEAEVIRR